MAKIYTVVVNDRPADPDVYACSQKEFAIQEARRLAKEYCRDKGDLEEKFHENNGSYFFRIDYSCESDSVMVFESEVNETEVEPEPEVIDRPASECMVNIIMALVEVGAEFSVENREDGFKQLNINIIAGPITNTLVSFIDTMDGRLIPDGMTFDNIPPVNNFLSIVHHIDKYYKNQYILNDPWEYLVQKFCGKVMTDDIF